MIGNNWIALLVSAVLAVIWLRVNDFFAHRGMISGPVSRKIIHIGTGPIFVLCWLLFTKSPSAAWIAALIPLLITAQFFLVGIGVIKDQAAVDAMSRTGDRREILRGPLYYGIVFVILTILYWYQNPIGIVALMLLCGGDGLADIVGKRVNGNRLPWSPHKSWAGSAAMFAGGWIFSMLVLTVFQLAGQLPGTVGGYLVPVTLITLAGTVVESLPFSDLDNLTVPAVAVGLGHLLF